MPKFVFITLFFLVALKGVAQRDFPDKSSKRTISNEISSDNADTLTAKRVFMQTNVYQNNKKLSKKDFSALLNSSKKWTKKNKLANILLPAAPIISAGGIYLAYDAIKGVPMVEIIDGVEYPYVVRSLPKLIGGIALFVTGLALIESVNETKMNATLWYNENLKSTKETAVHIKFGLSNSGGIGLVANF